MSCMKVTFQLEHNYLRSSLSSAGSLLSSSPPSISPLSPSSSSFHCGSSNCSSCSSASTSPWSGGASRSRYAAAAAHQGPRFSRQYNTPRIWTAAEAAEGTAELQQQKGSGIVYAVECAACSQMRVCWRGVHVAVNDCECPNGYPCDITGWWRFICSSDLGATRWHLMLSSMFPQLSAVFPVHLKRHTPVCRVLTRVHLQQSPRTCLCSCQLQQSSNAKVSSSSSSAWRLIQLRTFMGCCCC